MRWCTRWWRWTAWALAMLLGACVWSGCAAEGWHVATPTTMVRVDPVRRVVEFKDSKDNDLSIDSLTFNPETKTVEVKMLKITNNASRVREANVGQLDAVGREALMIGQAWQAGFQGAANLASAGVPILGGLTANPIWGKGQAGAVPQGWGYVGPTSQPAD